MFRFFFATEEIWSLSKNLSLLILLRISSGVFSFDRMFPFLSNFKLIKFCIFLLLATSSAFSFTYLFIFLTRLSSALLKALSDSYEDVNYHKENQDLGNAIEYIEDAKGIEDLEKAQDFLNMHKKAAAETLKDITRR